MVKPNTESPCPIQPVERPILCSPYVEPAAHWVYDSATGQAERVPGRRQAFYWYKSQRVMTQQLRMGFLAEEESEALPLVNALREDVKRWREGGYEGATQVTKELLAYWWREDRTRRLFFCQLEAAETIIFLNEIRLSKKYLRFHPAFRDEDLLQLRDPPLFSPPAGGTEGRASPAGGTEGRASPVVGMEGRVSPPVGGTEGGRLLRMGLKMATGSGKTVVMAMLIAWAFCNRGKVPSDTRFPRAALVVCPNLTIKERLQVLRPESAGNYYEAFDLVPSRMRPELNKGKVLITNWHLFLPESEHVESGQSYTVVNKGAEGPDAFARRVLGDLYSHSPLLVLNDEGHHAWRPKPAEDDAKGGKVDKTELEEATIWIEGLDKLNQAVGIRACVDLSATPFYLQGSGYVEGSPFPWLVSDFGLVDAIESGLVKIPRLPVSDTTGRPDPKYFHLWQSITEDLQPGEKLPGRGGRPKPEIVYREAEGALQILAGQWVERFNYIQGASDEKDKTPPVFIIVCDNTDLAEVFYRKISGEEEIEVEVKGHGKRKKIEKRTVYGRGNVFPEFSNTETFKPTVRIDSKLLDQAESDVPGVSRQEAAEQLRQIVATVGQVGQPGEQVRCVVAVAMLNEGWDAHNVTHIMGLRAFGSQLLCEQVVGRGLRRMDYTPDPETGLLTEEYVDIYGVPFSLIPFKGRPTHKPEPGDKPKNHVRAMPDRAHFEIKFPVVEGYAFALKRNIITADIDAIEPLRIEPEHEPTAVFVKPRVAYEIGSPSLGGPGEFELQDRTTFYASTHLQTIEFEIARQIVAVLGGQHGGDSAAKGARALRHQSRHQLFPQVLRLTQAYIQRHVDFRGEDPRELAQERYVQRIVERLLTAIRPDDSQGEPPLLPILNRYKPIGTTAEVDFKTTRPCFVTTYSHINLVAADTARWEQSTAFRLEQAVVQGSVQYYARNDQLGLVIPYDFLGISHHYQPDFLVRLSNGVTLILEIKGMETDEDRAKHEAAKRWTDAVNNWSQLGRWSFHICKDPQLLGAELANMPVSD